jgi:hypothetical protein
VPAALAKPFDQQVRSRVDDLVYGRKIISRINLAPNQHDLLDCRLVTACRVEQDGQQVFRGTPGRLAAIFKADFAPNLAVIILPSRAELIAEIATSSPCRTKGS